MRDPDDQPTPRDEPVPPRALRGRVTTMPVGTSKERGLAYIEECRAKIAESEPADA